MYGFHFLDTIQGCLPIVNFMLNGPFITMKSCVELLEFSVMYEVQTWVGVSGSPETDQLIARVMNFTTFLFELIFQAKWMRRKQASTSIDKLLSLLGQLCVLNALAFVEMVAIPKSHSIRCKLIDPAILCVRKSG